MKIKIRLCVLICFSIVYIIGHQIHAQNNKIDSLTNLLRSEKDSVKRFDILDELAWTYLNKNISKAIEYGEQSVALARFINNKKHLSYAINGLGTFYLNKPNYDKAMLCYQESLKLLEELGDYNNISKAHNNIGNIFQKINLDDKAIYEYKLALEFKKKAGGNRSPLMNYMNLGAIYFKIKNYPESKYYYEEAIKVLDTVKDISTIPLLYSNLGVIERQQNSYDKAMEYYHHAERISTRLKNPSSDLYNNIASLYEHKGDFQLANDYLLKSYAISLSKGQLDKLLHAYQNLANNYTYLNKGDSVRKYMSKYVNLRDSLYTDNSLKAIQEISAKYETEKKEQQITLLAKDKAIQDLKIKDQGLQIMTEQIEKEKKDQEILILNKERSLKEILIQKEKLRLEKNEKDILLLNSQKLLSEETISRQKTFSYFIITGLILALGLAFFIFKGLKQQKLANKIISDQKLLVESQKVLVDEKQKEILDSIHYAKRIQSTLLAHHDFVNANIPNSFILFKPKDIVSGDFYWATKKNNLFYIAVCDSTGHGVPGAFMSLLNIGFLNEAINEKNITSPDKIFNFVRERLIRSVSKDGQQDGFDGTLLCIDQLTNKITYASAHNSPVVVSNGEIRYLGTNKMPVGKGITESSFELFTINLNPFEKLYLYTDGFADQFGGERGKKFLYKKLNTLLVDISIHDFEQQKQILDQTFEKWKGNLEQVDDVLIMGISI